MTNWILYFFVYSFIGWIYESTYVTLKEKKFINRGFLHGPLVPIYGFGGIICIQCSILSGHNIFLTFMLAIIICTAMELSTGLAMESMFKVKYWNYNRYRYNYKGYICPRVSLLWGILALLVSFYIHPAVKGLISLLPAAYLPAASAFLIVLLAVDLTVSANEAIDLRHTFERLAENNRHIEILYMKLAEMQNELEENFDDVRDKMMDISLDARENIRILRKTGNVYLHNHTQSEKLSEIRKKLSEINAESVDEIIREIDSLQNSLKTNLSKKYMRARSILRRNPDSISVIYEEQLKRLKNMIQR